MSMVPVSVVIILCLGQCLSKGGDDDFVLCFSIAYLV